MRRFVITWLAVVTLTSISAFTQTSGQNYAVGNGPNFLAAGHLNGNGAGADLIVSNFAGESLSLLRNKGDGTFGEAVTLPVGKAPTAVAVADFTGLGKRDLAVALGGEDAVLILLNKGTGEFQTPLKISTIKTPGALAAADFNGDGRDDLIIASLNAPNATLLLSQGDDDFAAPQTLEFGYAPLFVITADVNRDGQADFITCPWQRTGPTQLGVYLGNGDGTFAEAKRFHAGQNALQVAVGDFNQDGKLDLVTANNFNRGAHVLLGNGDGSFQTATNYAIGDCGAVITGDFNNDGYTDFAVTNSVEAKVTIMLGNGTGTFPNKLACPVARGPVMLVVADFDRDGWRDLATVNQTTNNVTVLLGKLLTFPRNAPLWRLTAE